MTTIITCKYTVEDEKRYNILNNMHKIKTIKENK